jgi:Fe-Mn family superoxide dismutase
MKFSKLHKRISEIEEMMEMDEIITRQIEESEGINKPILLEMKKVGIERLPYSFSALEVFIDQETMSTHYNKHYKGYVDKLNKALEKRKGSDMELEQIVQSINRFNEDIRNNAGGAFNHALFWKMLTPTEIKPSGPILQRIKTDFGSLSDLKKKFNEEATKKFGSGWVWLVLTNSGKLKIMTTSNQDNPLMDAIKDGGYPLLGLDLWEHAYYLKYRNRRDEYIKNFWKVVNWKFVNKIYVSRTQRKINESVKFKQIISEGQSRGCNRNQLEAHRDVFNRNTDVKYTYRKGIDSILKTVFKEYWYDQNQYEPGSFYGVYDFEQPGRSVINKLNTNYTLFCTVINDVNTYLRHQGLDAINIVGQDPQTQIRETQRLINVMRDLQFRIFDTNSGTFKAIMSTLDAKHKQGDERELQAVVQLKKIFKTNEVFKTGELGSGADMLGGVDAYMQSPEGTKTMQIKPFGSYEEKDGKITVFKTAQVKPYKTDYLVFHNNRETIVFKNENTEIVDGNYVFPAENQIKG